MLMNGIYLRSSRGPFKWNYQNHQFSGLYIHPIDLQMRMSIFMGIAIWNDYSWLYIFGVTWSWYRTDPTQLRDLSTLGVCPCSINSPDGGDGIFQLLKSIPCLLMPWVLKSPGHQKVWYWLCRTDNMFNCSRLNFIYLGPAKSKIRFKIWLYLLSSLKQYSMKRVKILQILDL